MVLQSEANPCRFLRVLKGETLSPPPVWLMRQAGRYLPEYRAVRKRAGDFLTLCHTPALATEVTLQPVRRFGLDAAILFSDILVVPDTLGQRVTFTPSEGPKLRPLAGMDDVRALAADGWAARMLDHLASVYEAAESVRRALPPDVALIGFAGAPWTVATYMLEGGATRDGFAATRRWAEIRPEAFALLMWTLEEATRRHLLAQIGAGADAVQLFDSWAGAVPPERFDDWVVQPARRIISSVRAAHPDFPVIGFPRAAGTRALDYVQATGVSAVSLDQGADRAWAARHVQSRAAIQGNVDPDALLRGGGALEREVADALAAFGGGPHIMNLGHGIVKETPPAHVEHMVDLTRRGA